MAIHRLNHAVLYVSDLARSLEFYEGMLGFQRLPGGFAKAAFLQAAESANDHDLGLFEIGPTQPGPSPRVGLYHLAWEVATLADLSAMEQALLRAGALNGSGNHGSTKALYAQDPDGIELEVCWLVPDANVLDELVPGMPRRGSLTSPPRSRGMARTPPAARGPTTRCGSRSSPAERGPEIAAGAPPHR